MSHVISFADGEVIDIDSAEGAYKHIARHLRITGANSTYFSSLEKIRIEGNDDFIYDALREVIYRIEKCGASTELTNAVSLASDLCSAIGSSYNKPSFFAKERVKKELMKPKI